MDLDQLPSVRGIAVDDYKTRVRHQIANVQDNTLQYSVYCPSVDNQIDQQFNENLLDVLRDKKALRTKVGMLHAVGQFGEFLTKLKESKQTAFIQGEEVLALTYDIHFNPVNYAIEDIGLRLTRAMMTQIWNTGTSDKIDVTKDKRNAEQRILHAPRHHILNTWHDVMHAQNPTRTGIITYEEVTKRTNRLLAKKLFDDTVENGIGCLYRLDFEGQGTVQDLVNTKGKKNIIGSTLNAKKDAKEYGNSIRLAVVPATASREYMDSVNIVSLAEYEKNRTHIFSADLLESIAEFKTTKSIKMDWAA